jgi:hypothetical protein
MSARISSSIWSHRKVDPEGRDRRFSRASGEDARQRGRKRTRRNWKHEKNGRNFVDYYDCRLRFPILPPNSMISAAQQIIREVYS